MVLAFRNPDGSTSITAPPGVVVGTPVPLPEEHYFVVIVSATSLSGGTQNVGGAFTTYAVADAYRIRWEAEQAVRPDSFRGRTIIVPAHSDFGAQVKGGHMFLGITATIPAGSR